jgi:Rod binding domain-containing protein
MEPLEVILDRPVKGPQTLPNLGGVQSPSAAHVESVKVGGAEDARKKQLAKDFESVLLSKLFDQMKETIGDWGFEQDGASKQIQGLFWLYLAKGVADQGGFGLWKDIYQFFKQAEPSGGGSATLDKTL